MAPVSIDMNYISTRLSAPAFWLARQYIALHSHTQPYTALHRPTQPYTALHSPT